MHLSTTALVFPGQGSQSVGMLQELHDLYPLIQATFDEVSSHVGYDVWQLAQQGPEEQLNQTEYTQVAMLAADVALYRVLQATNPVTPRMMAGHSLGEYAALVCAGSLDLCAAAALVMTRGQLMQSTVPLGQGAMAAIIGLSDDKVQVICDAASTATEQVTPANYNAIGQIVIAGHTAAVARAIELAEQNKALMAKTIPVSVPCHCALLTEAATLFAQYLHECVFKIPNIAVVSNVDCSVYTSAEHIRRLLALQLHQPVRWVESIQSMQRQGVELFIECGPGKVLSGLIKRIDKSVKTASVLDILKV